MCYVVCGVWCVVCGVCCVLCVVCCVWCVLCGVCVVWCVLCVVWCVLCGVSNAPSTWSPAVFHPMSRSTTVLASVGVCVACIACASFFLVVVFAFALPVAFLRVSICILLSSSAPVPFPAKTVGDAQSFGKKNTIATKLFEDGHCLHTYPDATCS